VRMRCNSSTPSCQHNDLRCSMLGDHTEFAAMKPYQFPIRQSFT
jgi:hypothetical protein